MFDPLVEPLSLQVLCVPQTLLNLVALMSVVWLPQQAGLGQRGNCRYLHYNIYMSVFTIMNPKTPQIVAPCFFQTSTWLPEVPRAWLVRGDTLGPALWSLGDRRDTQMGVPSSDKLILILSDFTVLSSCY